MEVTVVICTRNRSHSLARTLQSIANGKQPDCSWEVLIVDNGSSDDTEKVTQAFSGLLPIRTIFEPVAGLSNARNTAVRDAEGNYIIWTDDDVVVQDDWLVAYVDAFRSWPDIVIFGGKIVPTLEDPVVPWFKRALPHISLALAARDLGKGIIPISREMDSMPYGANFAVRKAELSAYPFDSSLGAAPGRSRLGEETTVIRALLADGFKGIWTPAPQVNHMIGPERQTVGYLFNYYQAQGVLALRQNGVPGGAALLGVPHWLWRRLVTRMFVYYMYRLVAKPERWVKALTALAQDQGKVAFILEERRMAARTVEQEAV